MSFTINFGKCGLRSFDKPVVMGILNATPDSFYAGSRANSDSEILHRAEQMITEGAQMIDIGGFSTRPGAVEVSEAEDSDEAISLLNSSIQRVVDFYNSNNADKPIDKIYLTGRGGEFVGAAKQLGEAIGISTVALSQRDGQPFEKQLKDAIVSHRSEPLIRGKSATDRRYFL